MEHTLNADGINKAALLLMTLGVVLICLVTSCRSCRTISVANYMRQPVSGSCSFGESMRP
jgi:hypothetical protein